MRDQKADRSLVIIVVILMGLVTVKYVGNQSTDSGRHQAGQSSAMMLTPPS